MKEFGKNRVKQFRRNGVKEFGKNRVKRFGKREGKKKLELNLRIGAKGGDPVVMWVEMGLTEARLEGRTEAELGNQLLSEIHGLMEKLGAGLHQQMDIENTILDDVMIEIEFNDLLTLHSSCKCNFLTIQQNFDFSLFKSVAVTKR